MDDQGGRQLASMDLGGGGEETMRPWESKPRSVSAVLPHDPT